MWADVMERGHRSPNERAARHNGTDCGFRSLILLGPRTPRVRTEREARKILFY